MSSAALINGDLESSQNCKNKMALARSRFFARKIHKLKKMLKPLFSRKPNPQAEVGASIEDLQNSMNEDLQNSMNEALEARLAEDLVSSYGVAGDAIKALEDGEVTLIVVNPGASVPVPTHFFTSAPGRFSWTFVPSPDYDICPRGDVNAMSTSQLPEQQTPPPSPH